MGSLLRGEKMKTKLISDLHLTLTDNGEPKESYISFDKINNSLFLIEHCVAYEEYTDAKGNIEIYIPENDYHTGFYLKIPKNSNNPLDK
jgi:hypothetical protein